MLAVQSRISDRILCSVDLTLNCSPRLGTSSPTESLNFSLITALCGSARYLGSCCLGRCRPPSLQQHLTQKAEHSYRRTKFCTSRLALCLAAKSETTIRNGVIITALKIWRSVPNLCYSRSTFLHHWGLKTPLRAFAPAHLAMPLRRATTWPRSVTSPQKRRVSPTLVPVASQTAL